MVWKKIDKDTYLKPIEKEVHYKAMHYAIEKIKALKGIDTQEILELKNDGPPLWFGLDRLQYARLLSLLERYNIFL